MSQQSLFPLSAEQYLDLLERHARAVAAIKRTEAEKAAVSKSFNELLAALNEEERRLHASIREHQEAADPDMALTVEVSEAARGALAALEEARTATREFTTPPEEQ